MNQIEKRLGRLERLVKEFIEAYNGHCHDVTDFPSYGLATYPPKAEFKGNLPEQEKKE